MDEVVRNVRYAWRSGELVMLLRSRRRAEPVFQLDRWRSVFGARLAVEVQLHHVSGLAFEGARERWGDGRS